MQDLPLVSVVTCSYNNSKYIVDTLDSIKNQVYPNIELVIVDDCSTDNSVELISNWLTTYRGQYKFIKNETNLAGGIPYNIGLRNATGKYYSPIDSDDVMLPEKIAKQVQILEASDTKVGGIYSDAYVMDVHGTQLDGYFIQLHRQFAKVPSGNIYEQLLQGNYIPLLSVLFKRSVFEDIGVYDESLVYGDYDLWLRIARKYEILFSEYVSARYRIRPGSLTFTIKNWDYSDAKIFSKHTGAALPMERVRGIAHRVYIKNDKESEPYIKELATKTNDRYLVAVFLLWKYGVSGDIGEPVLARLNESIAAGFPATVNKAYDSEASLFLNEIVPAIPGDLIKRIASEAYFDDNMDAMPLVKELATKTNNLYLMTVYLVWKFHVSLVVGVAILGKIDESISAGLHANINPVNVSEIPIFLDYVVPAMPINLLMKLAYEAYVTKNISLIFITKELAKRTKHRYYKAVHLLSKFKVNVPNGIIILNRIEGYCNVNVSNKYIDLCIYKDIFGAIKTSNSAWLKSGKSV